MRDYTKTATAAIAVASAGQLHNGIGQLGGNESNQLFEVRKNCRFFPEIFDAFNKETFLTYALIRPVENGDFR